MNNKMKKIAELLLHEDFYYIQTKIFENKNERSKCTLLIILGSNVYK